MDLDEPMITPLFYVESVRNNFVVEFPFVDSMPKLQLTDPS